MGQLRTKFNETLAKIRKLFQNTFLKYRRHNIRHFVRHCVKGLKIKRYFCRNSFTCFNNPIQKGTPCAPCRPPHLILAWAITNFDGAICLTNAQKRSISNWLVYMCLFVCICTVSGSVDKIAHFCNKCLYRIIATKHSVFYFVTIFCGLLKKDLL